VTTLAAPTASRLAGPSFAARAALLGLLPALLLL
jgi:hypothetical protein